MGQLLSLVGVSFLTSFVETIESAVIKTMVSVPAGGEASCRRKVISSGLMNSRGDPRGIFLESQVETMESVVRSCSRGLFLGLFGVNDRDLSP